MMPLRRSRRGPPVVDDISNDSGATHARESERRQLKSFLSWKIIFVVVAFRCANALFLATYFNPDEFWQALEVAHEIAFGCGSEPTWEWGQDVQLRGYTHPLLFAALYKILAVVGLDSRFIVIAVPRLFQGVLAAACDICISLLAERQLGKSIGQWTLICSLSSWFMFYCLPRTFSNSLETTLTVVGLWLLYSGASMVSARASTSAASAKMSTKRYLVPWGAVLCAGFAVAVRPTALVTWTGIGIAFALFESEWTSRRIAASLCRRVVPAGFITLAVRACNKHCCDSLLLAHTNLVQAAAIVDRLCYGMWTFPPWNFIKVNVVHSVSILYVIEMCYHTTNIDLHTSFFSRLVLQIWRS